MRELSWTFLAASFLGPHLSITHRKAPKNLISSSAGFWGTHSMLIPSFHQHVGAEFFTVRTNYSLHLAERDQTSSGLSQRQTWSLLKPPNVSLSVSKAHQASFPLFLLHCLSVPFLSSPFLEYCACHFISGTFLDYFMLYLKHVPW